MSINATNSYRSSASLTLTVVVRALNDHAPVLLLSGNSTAVFYEASGPLNIGNIYRIVVSDLDSDTVFPQQAIFVTISGVLDRGYEKLSVNESKYQFRTQLSFLHSTFHIKNKTS